MTSPHATRQVEIPCFLGGKFYRTVVVVAPPMPDLYFAEFGKLVKFQVYQRYDGRFYYASDFSKLTAIIDTLGE